jgi:hypothetical protein
MESEHGGPVEIQYNYLRDAIASNRNVCIMLRSYSPFVDQAVQNGLAFSLEAVNILNS